MSDQSDIEEFNWNEDLISDSSENDLAEETGKSRAVLRDAVHKSMLPLNFESLKKFFDTPENSNVNKCKSQSSTSQSTKKEPSDAMKAYQEISYMKFKKIPSSEEESCCSKDSHVDSEDSGLFKEGYVFQHKSQPISKDSVNKKVKKWKKIASEQLEQVNKMYNHGHSKNKETFSMPLGLEANRKINAESPDDSSIRSHSRISGLYKTEDEMDVRRNDEFMREVRRVLRRKKNPQTLEKRSLPEEYSRLIFKKTAFVKNRIQQTQKALALTENGEPVTENTDTGVDGDNTSEPVNGIFDQLSEMVLKNKIVKNSKAAEQRNEVLKRVEEKRGFVAGKDNSDEDDKVVSRMANEKTNTELEPRPGPSSEVQIVSYDGQHQEPILNQPQTAEPDEFLNILDLKDTTKRRLKKVESYLSSVSAVQSVSPTLPEISELTSEREQSLFESLAGEFLKNTASGNERKNKITRNDKKLLTIIVKRFIDRGELCRIDDLMNSNMNENIFQVPPYENVTDREEFFLKKIIRKFIKRGMRNALEDLIAWIYYKLDARKTEQLDKRECETQSEKEVRDMVNAFKNSGKNSSMNKIIVQLLREHKKANPGLNARQIGAVKEMIKDLVIERFARMYLERTKTSVDHNSESYALSVNVNNEFEMNNGSECIDVNGNNVQINWEFASMEEGVMEQPHDVNTEHETDEESSVDETSPCSGIEPRMQSLNTKAIKQDLGKEANFVRERLEDIVWNVQQTYQRQKAGKANRTCSLVKKRSVTMIGDPNKAGKLNVKGKEKKLDFEERRKQMREEHVKWLLEQKEMLREAKKKEALNIEKFTQALPKRIENMIARRNRSMKQLDQRRAVDGRNNPTVKLWKK